MQPTAIPDVFDDPEELRPDRPTGPIMTFGYEPHFCLGARLELQEVIGGLLSEFPALRVAVAPDEVERRLDALVRGPWQLPLTW
ncbi:hypothetical protein ABZ599_37215 [Streptomyces misionensis]|uniref:hypothetical protein n=1 Tax=Streptomyces misionensis TaxID=67331 RepID=UPI0033C8DB1E